MFFSSKNEYNNIKLLNWLNKTKSVKKHKKKHFINSSRNLEVYYNQIKNMR